MANVTAYPLQNVCQSFDFGSFFIWLGRAVVHHEVVLVPKERRSGADAEILDVMQDWWAYTVRWLKPRRWRLRKALASGAPTQCVLGLVLLWLVLLVWTTPSPAELNTKLALAEPEMQLALAIDWVFLIKNELHCLFFGWLQLVVDRLGSGGVAATRPCPQLEGVDIPKTGAGQWLRDFQETASSAIRTCGVTAVLLSAYHPINEEDEDEEDEEAAINKRIGEDESRCHVHRTAHPKRWIEGLSRLHPMRAVGTRQKTLQEAAEAAVPNKALMRATKPSPKEAFCDMKPFCALSFYKARDDLELLTCTQEPRSRDTMLFGTPVTNVKTDYVGGVLYLTLANSSTPRKGWTELVLADLSGCTGPDTPQALAPRRVHTLEEIMQAPLLDQSQEKARRQARLQQQLQEQHRPPQRNRRLKGWQGQQPPVQHNQLGFEEAPYRFDGGARAAIPLGWEGVSVHFSNDDSESDTYTTYHISPQVKPMPPKQRWAWLPGPHYRKSSLPSAAKQRVRRPFQPNIYLLVHDGWSRAVYDSLLPQTRRFVEGISQGHAYEFFDFHGFHAAGDARTVQNEIPLLLGIPFDWQLSLAMMTNRSCTTEQTDGQTPIWVSLREQGYRTAYAGTHCNGIAAYRTCDPLELTFDHLAPFPFEDWYCLKSLNPDELYPLTFLCQGERRAFESYHRYFEQFFRRSRRTPKFAFFQFNFEHMRMPDLNNLYDKKARRHLRRIINSDPAGRSVIIVMGDHGPRGRCDDKNPGLWMIIGREVLRHHPKLRRSLRSNHESMFSMLDMHKTLRTLAGLPSQEGSVESGPATARTPTSTATRTMRRMATARSAESAEIQSATTATLATTATTATVATTTATTTTAAITPTGTTITTATTTTAPTPSTTTATTAVAAASTASSAPAAPLARATAGDLATRAPPRGEVCRRGPCDIGSTMLPWNRTCTDSLVHPVFCCCEGLWKQETQRRSLDEAILVRVLYWMNDFTGDFAESCVYPLRLKEVLWLRWKNIFASDLSIYQGDRPSLQSRRQKVEVVEMQFKIDPEPLEYRVQVLVLERSLRTAYKKALLCQDVLRMGPSHDLCLFQLGAIHRFARFETCTPFGMMPSMCYCRSSAPM